MIPQFRRHLIVYSLVFTVLLVGCSGGKKLTRRSELANPSTTGTIVVLMKDKTLYELSTYFLRDSLLMGKGTRKSGRRTEEFIGELNVRDMAYIQTEESKVLRGVVAVVGLGVLLSSAASSFGGTDGVSVVPIVRYRGPGTPGAAGSCPFLYSWTGQDFVLEAEAFGVALGRGLELETWSTLQSLAADDSRVRIRISNERPETHYVNSVRLHVAEVDTNATVYLSPNNRLWPSYKAIGPTAAFDHSGTDVREGIWDSDGVYWKSDLAGASADADFRDVIDMRFLNNDHETEGSLIVKAINTHLSEEIFQQFFTFLGDQSLAFIDAVEHDSTVIHTLRNWITESSLKAYVLTASGWEEIGSICPEANAVPFSRLLRFRTSQISEDTVKIRLVSLADVWKVDAVGVDWTPSKPLTTVEVPLLLAERADGGDVRPYLLASDDKYSVLLPADRIEFAFRVPESSSGKKTVYALGVQGFLYEGVPMDNAEQSVHLSAALPSEARVAFVKNLIQHKSLFLPPIYTAWKARKE